MYNCYICREFIIDANVTMIEALEKLDQVEEKILFVVHREKLVASLTDGDIRRWILSKGSLEASAMALANKNPKFVFEESKNEAEELMNKWGIDAVPVVDDKHKIVCIIFREGLQEIQPIRLNIPVVIMAGGLGTRLHPYTKILPKPLIPIGDIPITEHIMDRFFSQGCDRFFMIVNYKGNMIKAYFNEVEKPYEIIYVEEKESLGTGGGLSLLKGKIKETFILTNCDILIEGDYGKILKYHREQENLITMVCSLKHITIPYGVVDIDEEGRINGMREKPRTSFLVNTGYYIVESKVVDEMESNVSAGFPDIIKKYMEEDEKIGVYPVSENDWFDMGQFEELEDMKKKILKNS